MYRRTSEDIWDEAAAGLGGRKDIHFLDIDGTSEDDIVAVGMNGLLCSFNGMQWEIQDSPTNANLHAVYCSKDLGVYIVGQKGVAFHRKGSEWIPLAPEPSGGNFWDLECFGGKVHAAHGPNAILRWDDSEFTSVDFGLGFSPTTNHLTATNEVLWSIGSKHLMSYDGEKWELVPCPENE